MVQRYRVAGWLVVVALGAGWVGRVTAQDDQLPPIMVPGEQHEHLKPFVGTFKVEAKAWMDPAGDPMVVEAEATNTLIYGGRFVRMEFAADFMGMPMEGIGFFGHDNGRQQFVQTWLDSMGTQIIYALGPRAEDGTITLVAEQVDPMSGDLVPAKMVYQPSETGYTFTLYEGAEDNRVMEMVHTRVD